MIKSVTIILTVVGAISTSAAQSPTFKRTLKAPVIVVNKSPNLLIQWEKVGNYTVYQGDHPTTIQWNNPIHVVGKKELVVPEQQARQFFGIVNAQQDTLIVSERKLPFVHADNFRDLGGIKTVEGRYVNWGRFYRSDALNRLDDQEFVLFDGLGIKKIYDLRSDEEIKQGPDHVPPGVTYIHWPIFNMVNAGFFEEIEGKVASGDFTVAAADDLLISTNKDFAGKYHEEFKGLLAQIFSDTVPSVFHCSSGKDRTGFTAAMILAILKVDRGTIFEEYEMTNFYIQDELDTIVSRMSKELKIAPDKIQGAMYALMGVKKAYLSAAFEVIDKQYGGIDAYIKNQLGISDQEREELIQRYTYAL